MKAFKNTILGTMIFAGLILLAGEDLEGQMAIGLFLALKALGLIMFIGGLIAIGATKKSNL